MTSKEFRTRLLRRSRKVDLDVPSDVVSALEAYFALLARWNTKVNLTALPLNEPTDETFDRLLIEPLVAARHIVSSARRLIDLGSGGGSPALPIAVSLPELSVRMVESKTRKSAFLREAVRVLQLRDAVVETERFEELLTRPELHEWADVLTIRAVRIEERVLQTVQAFVRPGGQLLLFRSAQLGDAAAPRRQSLKWVGAFPLVDRSQLVVLERTDITSS